MNMLSCLGEGGGGGKVWVFFLLGGLALKVTLPCSYIETRQSSFTMMRMCLFMACNVTVIVIVKQCLSF